MTRSTTALLAALLAAGAAFAQPTGTTGAHAAATTQVDAFELDLGGVRFDPLYAPPAVTGPWAQARGAGPDWRLVQFDGAIQPQWLDALRNSGLEPVQYLHPYTYIVWGDASALTRAAASPGVRWTGDFLPAYKVRPEQRRFGGAPRPTMLLVSRQITDDALRADFAALEADVQLIAPLDTHLQVVQLSVRGDRYLDLAQMPAVYTVQDIPQDAGPRGEMSNQSIVGNYGAPPANTIVPGYAAWLTSAGYNGTGVRVGIVDGGIRTTHTDLASRIQPCVSAGGAVTSCTTNNNAHGTHVAGAVAGTGATGILLGGFLRGQGVAPDANLVQQRYGSFLGGGPGGMIANGMLTIYKESALSGAILTNNSWGPTGTPQGYDIPTQQVDMVTRDANPDVAGQQPVLNVVSIMNGNGDGTGACAPSALGSPDEAKNLFAVGSTKLQTGAGGTQIAAIFDISANSAHGNACDGRRVPHIVAPGCSTDSTTSSSDTAHSATSCGTSMASPVVSGAIAVFVEKYRDQHAGATPSPALIKAAFTPVATNLNGFLNADGGIMGHRPDRFQGYGRLDLNAVMNSSASVYAYDQAHVFTASAQTWTRALTAAQPGQPMRLMLAWTDAKGHGLGGTTPAWVNNLDLSVTSGASTFRGNVVGANGWSATGGSADAMNNLEGVFLQPSQHNGAISVTVTATNIAADALNPHTPGTPAQDFALVCYNCTEAPLGSANLGLSLTDLPDPAPAGGRLDYVATVANFGPDAVTGVRVQLPLPPALSFVGGRLVSGGGDWTCSAAASVVTCQLTSGSLAVGAFAATLQIETQVSLGAAPGPINATGTVSAPLYTDSVPGNNSMAVTTTITAPLDTIFRHNFE